MIFAGPKISDRLKIQLNFLIVSILILILPFLGEFGSSTLEKFLVCFFVMFIFGLVDGVLIGATLGLASILPPKYIGVVMFG